MRRGLVVGVQIALLLLAGASPALSHATFPGQGALTAQADQTLNMAVPEEEDPDNHNAGVTVALPTGWTAVRCQATAPWQCTITPGQIQWTKVPATAPPGPNDVAFAFTVHTGGPGSYPIPVIQTYMIGDPVRWIGPPNSDYPAPVLTVSAPATSPAPPASPAPAPPAPAAPSTPASPAKSPPASAPPAAAPAPASPHPTASTAHPAATATTPPAAAAPTSSPSPPATPTATQTASPSPSPTSTVISAAGDHGGKKVAHSGSGAPLAIGAIVVVALFGAGWAALRRRRAHG